MKKRRKLLNQEPGVSLIIAIIFTSAFMLVMAGLFKARLQTINSIGNRELQGKTEYLGQSSLELASYWAATHFEGQNTTDFIKPGGMLDNAKRDALFKPLYDAAADLGIASCSVGAEPCAGFEVVGRGEDLAAKKVDKAFNGATQHWFSVPLRNTGNAAPACSPNDSLDADQGCNWNRLYVGKSTEIPLYYVDSNGATKVITDDFKLRMRSPCKDANGNVAEGVMCAAADRIVLYPRVSANPANPFTNINKDAVIMQWIMEDVKNGSSIVAWDAVDSSMGPTLRIVRDNDMNTEISGGRINDANDVISPAPRLDLKDFIVLEKKYYGKALNTKDLTTIAGFLSDAAAANGKPILRLSVVGQPRKMNANEQADYEFGPSASYPNRTELNDSSRKVPYLEYQLLTLTNPASDSKSYLSAWAEFGGFRKEFKKEYNRSTSGGGFALENF